MPVFQLTDEIVFPRPELAEENGLLAIGGDLSPQRLITAYSLGIFPWFSQHDPILWWFTSPRLVIYPSEFRVSKRLLRLLKKKPFTVTVNQAFEQVIRNCAEIRTEKNDETWITDSMMDAYIALHKCGYAHSIECWQGDLLAGGLYGIALDQVFFGESMFSRVSNSSKVALVELNALLQKNNFKMIDCQMTTAHLLTFGAREISGKVFSKNLHVFIRTTNPSGAFRHDS